MTEQIHPPQFSWTCPRVLRYISAGSPSLDLQDVALLELHLETCADCREAMDTHDRKSVSPWLSSWLSGGMTDREAARKVGRAAGINQESSLVTEFECDLPAESLIDDDRHSNTGNEIWHLTKPWMNRAAPQSISAYLGSVSVVLVTTLVVPQSSVVGWVGRIEFVATDLGARATEVAVRAPELGAGQAVRLRVRLDGREFGPVTLRADAPEGRFDIPRLLNSSDQLQVQIDAV